MFREQSHTSYAGYFYPDDHFVTFVESQLRSREPETIPTAISVSSLTVGGSNDASEPSPLENDTQAAVMGAGRSLQSNLNRILQRAQGRALWAQVCQEVICTVTLRNIQAEVVKDLQAALLATPSTSESSQPSIARKPASTAQWDNFLNAVDRIVMSSAQRLCEKCGGCMSPTSTAPPRTKVFKKEPVLKAAVREQAAQDFKRWLLRHDVNETPLSFSLETRRQPTLPYDTTPIATVPSFSTETPRNKPEEPEEEEEVERLLYLRSYLNLREVPPTQWYGRHLFLPLSECGHHSTISARHAPASPFPCRLATKEPSTHDEAMKDSTNYLPLAEQSHNVVSEERCLTQTMETCRAGEVRNVSTLLSFCPPRFTQPWRYQSALCEEMETYWKLHRDAEARARLMALRNCDANAFVEHVSVIQITALLSIMERTHAFMHRIGERIAARAAAKKSKSATAPQSEQEGAGAQQTNTIGAHLPSPAPTLTDNPSALNVPTEGTTTTTCISQAYQRFKAYMNSTKDEFRLVHAVDTFVERSPSTLSATLLPHQMDGLRFLASLHANDINGILADEMGVGKTIQTIAFLLHLKETKEEEDSKRRTPGRIMPNASATPHPHRPHLVLAPLSVVREWAEACETFIRPGALRVTEFLRLTEDGDDTESDATEEGVEEEENLKSHSCVSFSHPSGSGKKPAHLKGLSIVEQVRQHFDLVLLPIHSVRFRLQELVQIEWDYIVVDEAHKAVSNLKTITAQSILQLSYQRRLVLTGTPLSSDLRELWSLLYFLNPDVFSDGDSFDHVFHQPFKVYQCKEVCLTDEHQELLILRLHQILRPFMLRRTKKDVCSALRMTFHELECPLTAVQKSLLQLLREKRRLPVFHPPQGRTSSSSSSSSSSEEDTEEVAHVSELSAKDLSDLPSEEGSPCTVSYFSSKPVLDAECVNLSSLGVSESTAQALCNHAFMHSFFPLLLSLGYQLHGSKREWNQEAQMLEQLQRQAGQQRCGYHTTTRLECKKVEAKVESGNKDSAAVSQQQQKEEEEPTQPRSRSSEERNLGCDNNAPPLQLPSAIALPTELVFPSHYSKAGAASMVLASSGKFLLLHLLLLRVVVAGRKAVIFTHWLDCMDLLADYFASQGWSERVEMLSGNTSEEERKTRVRRFQDDATCSFFVVSMKAGGCGINLQVAHLILLMDRDYTLTNEDQALARVYRIGQRHTVRAISLTTSDRAERKVVERAIAKNKPRQAIIENGKYLLSGEVESAERNVIEEERGRNGTTSENEERRVEGQEPPAESELNLPRNQNLSSSAASGGALNLQPLWEHLQQHLTDVKDPRLEETLNHFSTCPALRKKEALRVVCGDAGWFALHELIRLMDDLVLTEEDKTSNPDVCRCMRESLPPASSAEFESAWEREEQERSLSSLSTGNSLSMSSLKRTTSDTATEEHSVSTLPELQQIVVALQQPFHWNAHAWGDLVLLLASGVAGPALLVSALEKAVHNAAQLEDRGAMKRRREDRWSAKEAELRLLQLEPPQSFFERCWEEGYTEERAILKRYAKSLVQTKKSNAPKGEQHAESAVVASSALPREAKTSAFPSTTSTACAAQKRFPAPQKAEKTPMEVSSTALSSAESDVPRSSAAAQTTAAIPHGEPVCHTLLQQPPPTESLQPCSDTNAAVTPSCHWTPPTEMRAPPPLSIPTAAEDAVQMEKHTTPLEGPALHSDARGAGTTNAVSAPVQVKKRRGRPLKARSGPETGVLGSAPEVFPSVENQEDSHRSRYLSESELEKRPSTSASTSPAHASLLSIQTPKRRRGRPLKNAQQAVDSRTPLHRSTRSSPLDTEQIDASSWHSTPTTSQVIPNRRGRPSKREAVPKEGSLLAHSTPNARSAASQLSDCSGKDNSLEERSPVPHTVSIVGLPSRGRGRPRKNLSAQPSSGTPSHSVPPSSPTSAARSMSAASLDIPKPRRSSSVAASTPVLYITFPSLTSAKVELGVRKRSRSVSGGPQVLLFESSSQHTEVGFHTISPGEGCVSEREPKRKAMRSDEEEPSTRCTSSRLVEEAAQLHQSPCAARE